MTKFRTHYDNLQISRSASPEVIKAAYRTLSAKYHPDRNWGDARSAEIMSILNASYAVLCDEQARRQHDAWIQRQEAARSRPKVQPSTPSEPTDEDELPAWSPQRSAANAERWRSVKERSAATEAALAQGRLGKLTTLLLAAGAACLLVFALLSEQRSRWAASATSGSPSAASVGIASTPVDASGRVVRVSTQREQAPERAIQIATNFAEGEGLLRGPGYTVRIHDDGEAWLVSFRAPPERTAAAPIVLIDKERLEVIGYYAAGR